MLAAVQDASRARWHPPASSVLFFRHWKAALSSPQIERFALQLRKPLSLRLPVIMSHYPHRASVRNGEESQAGEARKGDDHVECVQCAFPGMI